jgi:hypothetical protein
MTLQHVVQQRLFDFGTKGLSDRDIDIRCLFLGSEYTLVLLHRTDEYA